MWQTDELRRPLIVLAVMFTFVFNWQVLMPLLAEVSFNAGPKEFGLLSAAAGIGSLVGAVTTAHGNRHPGMGRLGVFSLLVGGSMVLVALAPTLGLAMLTMVPLGYAAMCFMITGNTMLQLNAKPQARGRVMALYGIVFLGSTPIGAPIAGWLGQRPRPARRVRADGRVAGAIGVVVLWMRARRATAADEAADGDRRDGARARRRRDPGALTTLRARGARASPARPALCGRRSRCRPRARAGSPCRSPRAPSTGSLVAPHCSDVGSPASFMRRSICARCETSHGSTGVHARNTTPITTSVAPGDSTGNSATASTAATSRAML